MEVNFTTINLINFEMKLKCILKCIQLLMKEIFIKTLKNKIYKHMTAIGKNIYFNVLDDIVKDYNNSIHSSIKMKPKDVEDDSFVEYIEKSNKKDPKFKIGDHVRISKYKNIFFKGYLPNWSEEIFAINKVKTLFFEHI